MVDSDDEATTEAGSRSSASNAPTSTSPPDSEAVQRRVNGGASSQSRSRRAPNPKHIPRDYAGRQNAELILSLDAEMRTWLTEPPKFEDGKRSNFDKLPFPCRSNFESATANWTGPEKVYFMHQNEIPFNGKILMVLWPEAERDSQGALRCFLDTSIHPLRRHDLFPWAFSKRGLQLASFKPILAAHEKSVSTLVYSS